MNDKLIIAGILLEIAKNSTTELIEDSKIDDEIKEAAKKMGMVIPSPDFAVFKTKWADIDKKNLNNVKLPRKAVEEGIQTLVGKNLNFEHLGAYNVCGFCLSVKIKKDEIESINVFYRSLYPDKFEELKEKIKAKEAAVSFEIYNTIDGKSVIKELEDGTKEIIKIHCHGTGLLMLNPPGCPTAKIFKLVAKKEIQEAEQIVDKVFSEDLIFASLAIEEPKCKNCGNCNYKKEENRVELEKLFANVTKEEEITFELAMAFYYSSEEEQNKLTEDAAKWTRKFINGLPDSAFAVIEPAYPEKTDNKNARHLPHHSGEGDLGKDKSNANLDLPHYKNALARVNQIKPITDSISAEDLQKKASNHLERHRDALEKSSETKPEVNSAETKPVEGAETKSEENKGEETKDNAQGQPETIVPKIVVKVTRIYSDVYVDTYKDGTQSGTSEGKSKYKIITEYSDGTEDVVETDSEYKKKFDYAELEEKVNAAKAEKDAEITTLKAEQEQTIKAKDEEIKNLNETKDKEITNLKQELATKEQEIATLKKPAIESAEEKPELDVGAVEKAQEDKYKETAQEIKDIAWGNKKIKR